MLSKDNNTVSIQSTVNKASKITSTETASGSKFSFIKALKSLTNSDIQSYDDINRTRPKLSSIIKKRNSDRLRQDLLKAFGRKKKLSNSPLVSLKNATNYSEYETESILNALYLKIAGRALSQIHKFRETLQETNIFRRLGTYQEIPDKYFNSYPNGHPLYQYPNMALINEKAYCDVVDLYNLYHPSNVFKYQFFFTDYNPEGTHFYINK